ncbi:MAG: hypothetical protein KGI98_00945 [Euryarchaeota archaeon]|nr:hypothetical protein [Euryarchaeota archaeon]MDE1880699.1 hypothetical protein [Euryarchaeota archaeon]
MSEQVNARLLELGEQASRVGPEDRKQFIASLQQMAAQQAEMFRTLASMMERLVALQTTLTSPVKPQAPSTAGPKTGPDVPMYG